jgi:hypothetical protein
VTELEAKVAAREKERKAARQSQKTSGAPADPAAEVEREHRRRMRELSDQAHGVNLDVGAGLLNGLSTVDPTDVNVVISRRPGSVVHVIPPTGGVLWAALSQVRQPWLPGRAVRWPSRRVRCGMAGAVCRGVRCSR